MVGTVAVVVEGDVSIAVWLEPAAGRVDRFGAVKVSRSQFLKGSLRSNG